MINCRFVEGHAGEATRRVDRGIPVGRPPTVELRNSHLSYVITWCAVHPQTRVSLNKVVGMHSLG